MNIPGFVVTDSRCRIDSQAYPGIPIFFDTTGVIAPLSDYMIFLVYRHRRPTSTVQTYAYHLQKFLKHINKRGVQLSEVSDGTLIAWRDRMIGKERLKAASAAAALTTTFNFYQWAQESGYLQYAMALHPDDQVDSKGDIVYRISAMQSQGGTDYCWPYMPSKHPAPIRHTPVSEELQRLHVEVFRAGNGQRDSLILSFYEELCLRRAEALSIGVDDIPAWGDIEAAIESDSVFTLSVIGKGNKKRHVPALPELMGRVREYIEEDRALAIQRARSRNRAFQVPSALFVGKTTGKALSKQYVSRRLTNFMQLAGIENASGHRVRASGLTALAEAFDGIDRSGRPLPAEQVLWKVADRAGHAHWESLRPYLNLARSPVFGSDREKQLRSAGRVRMLEHRLAQLRQEVRDVDLAHRVISAIQAGDIREAEAILVSNELSNE